MEGASRSSVSNRAWIELLHAETCWALERGGVDALVVKGPSLMDWLYPDGGRESADVDLLVRPEHWRRAVLLLTRVGFQSTYPGVRAGETADHSLDLQRHDPELGGHGVDLHKYFPGVGIAPSAAFDVLWGRRERATQAGVSVWYPDRAARALLTALHAARDPLSAKVAEDLRRSLAALSDAETASLAELAAELSASGVLRAGLETHPDTAGYVAALGLSSVEVPERWALVSHHAGRTAVRLHDLGRMPWRERPGQVARWLFPSPAMMRVRDPRASRGAVGLGVAYAARLGQGARTLPRAVRHLRTTRGATHR